MYLLDIKPNQVMIVQIFVDFIGIAPDWLDLEQIIFLI